MHLQAHKDISALLCKGSKNLVFVVHYFCVKLVKNACLCYMRLIPVLHMCWDPLQWAINGQSNIQAPQSTSSYDPSRSPDKESLHAALCSVQKQNDHQPAHWIKGCTPSWGRRNPSEASSPKCILLIIAPIALNWLLLFSLVRWWF